MKSTQPSSIWLESTLPFLPSQCSESDGWMNGEVVGWLMSDGWGGTEREREEEEEKTKGVLLGH